MLETLDMDPALEPDHIGSVLEMPFPDESYDVVCAFQMLEHIPFVESLRALAEIARVSKKGILISLPDCAVRWPMSIYMPKLGTFQLTFPKPRVVAPVHKFDGQHYWEINKKGYSLPYVIKSFEEASRTRLLKTFRVHEHTYHRFFVFGK
jgi:ubiquinone/menaquinone biosynthesis C-methylase UbiE